MSIIQIGYKSLITHTDIYDDISENTEEYSPDKKRKILIACA